MKGNQAIKQGFQDTSQQADDEYHYRRLLKPSYDDFNSLTSVLIYLY